jgi:hypothetical protein
MAKGKDIAGLAALGTLAYMMGRKQGAAPSTSSEANKPPSTMVTPAAVAPPRPVTSNSEEARQAASDAREDMRNDQQVNAVGASAPVAVRPPAPVAARPPVAVRPPPAPAPVAAPAPARYRPAADSNAASNAMASRDIYPERAATRDAAAAADAARRARMAAAVTQGIGRGQSTEGLKRGGAVKGYANGGSVSSRADGIAQRGKTNCKIC